MSEPAASGAAAPGSRSLKRSFAALVLVGEVLVVGFAALVAKDLSDVDGATLAWVTGGVAAVCLLAAGSLRSPVGYAIGWIVQLLLVVSGVWVPLMFFLGLLFAGIWAAAVVLGGRADAITAQRLRRAER